MVVLSFLGTVYSDKLLPEQYLRDSEYFGKRIETNVSGYSDSFQTIVNLYRFFGIEKPNVGLRIIVWLVFFLALSIVRFKNSRKYNSSFTDLISAIYLLFVPLYGSQFSKEFLVILLIIPTLIALRIFSNKKTLIILMTFQLSIILLIRQYYLITILGTILFVVIRKKSKLLRVLIPIVFVGLFTGFDSQTGLTSQLFGMNLFEIRNQINSDLIIQANTRIFQSAYTPNVIENIFIYIKVLINILFPLNVLTFSGYSVVIFLASFILSCSVVTPYFINRIDKIFEPSFLLAYFFTASIFEPDLGSFSRHTFVYLLFTLRCVYIANSNIQANKVT